MRNIFPLSFSRRRLLVLWGAWWQAVQTLRPACRRLATFLWLATVLAALCLRPDLAGVTSLVRGLGLVDTLPALMAPNLVTPFGVFLLRQFFMTIPKDLSEAARIDGCSEFRIFWQIVLPLCRPALMVVVPAVRVSVPAIVRVPEPSFVILPVPETAPAKVVLVVSTGTLASLLRPVG